MVVAEVCSSMKYPKRCQYKHAKQKKYHVRNWAEYNEGLRRRGDLTVWFDEEAIANWKADKTGKPGGCLRCLLLVMCTHPFAKKALTLHLARSEGHERDFICNLMHRKVLASSHQHLIAEAPAVP